ncbi:VC0807 family protein [Cellvibrio sp. NN19]|uniref:VC0807 family protein n=1 Tax=Cellvibrio chitinivorans TaxID=3102792 RepID=UPI002B40F112|nr:VC0807 family protein [Cellvibrio sp. NN19]
MLAEKPPLEPANSQPKPKKESFLANLLMNIVIPTLILTKLSGDEYLGATWGLIIALAFPISYGLRDFLINKKVNVFSALGVVSVLLTGGLSLLHLDPKYFAIKEAAIPGLLGIATLISIKTRYPLVKTFIYNDKVLKIQKVDDALQHYGTQKPFERTLNNASLLIAGSFFLSSALNYILAKIILVSQPGTAEFNAELGKMTALSYPVIALPMMLIMMGTLFYVFRSIRLLTHLTLEEVINDGSEG